VAVVHLGRMGTTNDEDLSLKMRQELKAMENLHLVWASTEMNAGVVMSLCGKERKCC